jgi:hypothetical protein
VAARPFGFAALEQDGRSAPGRFRLRDLDRVGLGIGDPGSR